MFNPTDLLRFIGLIEPADTNQDLISVFNSKDEISMQELIDSLERQSPNSEIRHSINKLDSYGYNLLHRAIISGNKELVIEFIKYNADLTIVNRFKRSPLELALQHKNNEIALLIWDEIKDELIMEKIALPWYKLIWLRLRNIFSKNGSIADRKSNK